MMGTSKEPRDKRKDETRQRERRGAAMFCAFLLCFFFLPAQALRQDAGEPIRVSARTVETDEKTGVAIYRGAVHVEQGTLSLRADRVEIRTRDRHTEFVRATGKPATLRQRAEEARNEVRAEADQIDYHVLSGKVEMKGNVTVHRGGDLFTAATLQYDLNDKTLQASGGEQEEGRIHAVIQPAEGDTKPRSRP
jgi:lipopolysaccharide export system protein LptA